MTQAQLVRALRKLADILETAEGLVIFTSDIKISHTEYLSDSWGIESRIVRIPAPPITLTVDIQASLQSYELHESDALNPSANH